MRLCALATHRRPALRRWHVPILFLLATALPGQSGKDLRDVVVTTRGKEIRGRVVQRFDPKEVLLVQGGKRVRVPHARVASMTTVTDHLREFFRLRAQAKNVVAKEWTLVEWAQSKQLPEMARLQAMHVVLLDDGNQKAHEFLGHRRKGSEWLWPHKSSWMTRQAYERATDSWGKGKKLGSEHFDLQTNADLRHAVDTLLDLERLYVYWFDTFGAALRPREVLRRMKVNVWASQDEFPAFTSLHYPYYFPQPFGDDAYTYFAAQADRPELLFQLGVEQLIYDSLLNGATAVPTQRDRVAAWVEIGLGQWVQHSFAGAPGYAAPGPMQLDRNQAYAVLTERPYGLVNLIGVRYALFHEPTSQTAQHWAQASTFVAFLMDDTKSDKTREGFLKYVDLVYTQQKGNSSSLLDRALGEPLEKLEKPWITWLEQKTGIRATRRH